MSKNLMTAHNQWATRPADERFENLDDMLRAVAARKNNSVAKIIDSNELVALPHGDDVRIASKSKGDTGKPIIVNNYAFGQLAQQAGAPASYLRKLPTELACDLINHGLNEHRAADAQSSLFIERHPCVDDPDSVSHFTLRSINGVGYTRVFDEEIIRALMPMRERGWSNPLAYANGEFGGELRGGGLYAGDRNSFIFMVNEENRINDGSDQGLARGFFVWNSETGDRSFGGMTFLYRYVCGNNIVWGAENVVEFRMRHTSGIRHMFEDRMFDAITAFGNESAAATEEYIRRAQTMRLVDSSILTQQEADKQVVDVLYNKRIASKSQASQIITLAREYQDVDGDPVSVYGLTQGATRLAGYAEHADTRTQIETAATKIMQLAKV